MSAAEELDKLKKLHAAGTITDEQYERAKAKLEAEMAVGARDERTEDKPRACDNRAEPREERRDPREERKARREPRPWRRDDRDDRDEDEDDYDERRPSAGRHRKQVREWGTVLHLSVVLGHVAVALGGIIAPIVIWQMKKDELPELDEHGKNAVNWVLSFLTYMGISIVLCFVLIGFVLLPVVLLMNLVFPIIAAIKANEGRVWKYPLAIRFLK
jgi:uncharacterized Tic20 family protein